MRRPSSFSMLLAFAGNDEHTIFECTICPTAF